MSTRHSFVALSAIFMLVQFAGGCGGVSDPQQAHELGTVDQALSRVVHEAAFQANTGNLWVVGKPSDPGDLGLGMMAGTSPRAPIKLIH